MCNQDKYRIITPCLILTRCMIPIKNAFRNNFKGEIVRNLELSNCFSVSATLCSNWVFSL